MAQKIVLASLMLILLIGSLAAGKTTATAQTSTRQITIEVPYTQYEWWMMSWVDNEFVCTLLIDHEGLPTNQEVRKQCGDALYLYWINTPPCQPALDGEEDTSGCAGVYLHLVSIQPKQREVVVDLPLSTVHVNLEGCVPKPPENLCQNIPSLLLIGEEPLPNENITALRGVFDGIPFVCPGSVCKLPLRATPVQGITVEFWAESSYGDTSEHYTAQVRVIDTGVSTGPGTGGWYVDVVSSQWVGAPLASCARIWEAFPPIGGSPTWLSTPERPELLASGAPYFYLAGRLISQGIVDASSCQTGGMLPNGYSDACGLEKAKPVLLEWQNQFDKRIITIAKETGVPAQLMKNLFAQESQFWPGVFRVPYEFGLGQITDQGVDSILIWNDAFYEQFCPLVLAEDACARGYMRLKSDEQALLRGALANQANATCTDCPAGIDLANAEFSVDLFAQTLKANCSQVGQTIYTATQQTPGQVASYEDLWRFTVANYHAGAGCVSYAIHQAWVTTGKLSWENVSARFTEACKGVVPYVNKITGK